MALAFKVYGSEKIQDDHFLTAVGSFGSIANGCTRAVWALFFDKYGFKKVYFVLLIIQVNLFDIHSDLLNNFFRLFWLQL